MLKENLISVFAATIDEPSDEEMEYIFSKLPLSESDYDFTTHLHSCSIPCDCEPNTVVYGFKFESPYQTEEEEERELVVILCSGCGKWACCD